MPNRKKKTSIDIIARTVNLIIIFTIAMIDHKVQP